MRCSLLTFPGASSLPSFHHNDKHLQRPKGRVLPPDGQTSQSAAGQQGRPEPDARQGPELQRDVVRGPAGHVGDVAGTAVALGSAGVLRLIPASLAAVCGVVVPARPCQRRPGGAWSQLSTAWACAVCQTRDGLHRRLLFCPRDAVDHRLRHHVPQRWLSDRHSTARPADAAGTHAGGLHHRYTPHSSLLLHCLYKRFNFPWK